MADAMMLGGTGLVGQQYLREIQTKSELDSRGSARMSPQEFAEWYATVKAVNGANVPAPWATPPTETRKLRKRRKSSTPSAQGTPAEAAGAAAAAPDAAADPAPAEGPAAAPAQNNVRQNLIRGLTIAWSMLKCLLFLAYVLPYDGHGLSMSFFLAALLLFGIHVLQINNAMNYIVVVRRPRQAEATPPQQDQQQAEPAAADAAAPAPAPAAAQPRPNIAGLDGVLPAAAEPAAAGAAVAEGGAPPAGAAPPQPPRSLPRLVVVMVMVFFESLLPSWTLRELDRHQ